jgi:hypothetical protein
MSCAVDHDPLVALVRHAGVKEINTVIVAGVLRKVEGKLLDLPVKPYGGWKGCDNINAAVESGFIPWKQAAVDLAQSRREIQKRTMQCDIGVGRKKMLEFWGSEKRFYDLL